MCMLWYGDVSNYFVHYLSLFSPLLKIQYVDSNAKQAQEVKITSIAYLNLENAIVLLSCHDVRFFVTTHRFLFEQEQDPLFQLPSSRLFFSNTIHFHDVIEEITNIYLSQREIGFEHQ